MATPVLLIDAEYTYSKKPIDVRATVGLISELRDALEKVGEHRFPPCPVVLRREAADGETSVRSSELIAQVNRLVRATSASRARATSSVQSSRPIFTHELCAEVGFSGSLRSRLLNALSDRWMAGEVNTVRELCETTEAELLRRPDLGRKALELVRAVLGKYGLRLR
jgi:hypothetical protein